MNSSKVKVLFNTPIITEGDTLKLDSILQDVCGDLLIKETNGLYHASQGFFEKPCHSGVFLLKDKVEVENLQPPTHSKKIDTGSGGWQVYKRSVQYLEVASVTFYCHANEDFIYNTLMQKVRHLGYYTHLGFGEIKEVVAERMQKDYSFCKNGMLMRSIPLGVELEVDLGDKPLNTLSYHQGYDDCYHQNKLVLCHIPN